MAMQQRGMRGLVEETPVGDLVRQFGQDSAMLVRKEIALARLELKEAAVGYVRDAARLGVAAALGWFAAMALVAALILGVGALINSYWLSALLVAVMLLGAAALLARSALRHMKRSSLKPELTMETLDEDRRWARREAQELKRQLKH